MNKKGRNRLISVFLAALAASALFACGAADDDRKLYEGGAATAATAVGMDVCATCHLGMVEEWLATPHANMNPADPSNLGYAGTPDIAGIAACTQTCHNPDLDVTAGTLYDSNHLIPNVTGPVGGRPVVGCEACHGLGSNHNGSGPIGPTRLLATSFGAVSVSGQVRTCNDCHELLDTTTGGVDAALVHSVTLPTGTEYQLTDTHYATGGDFSGPNMANKNRITGYAMSYASETACTDCHNPHKSTEIIREWAKSAHADMTANFDSDSNYTTLDPTADPLGYFSGAWAHYNWSCTTVCGPTGSRTACQRCHTTTGFAAYADALKRGDAVNAQAIAAGTAPPVPYSAAFKPEMLKCNGCHSDNKGSLRNPGPITANYDVVVSGTTRSKFSFAYPDVSNSNICMACHTAREAGDSIKNLNTGQAGTSAFDFTNSSFISSHYLSAGGTMFRVTGYEFDGRSYENLSIYKHFMIGTSAVPNTGTNGPCIGCHMSRPGGNGDHLFLPVNRGQLVYGTGTVAVTNSSPAVTGTGTTWTTAGMINVATDVMRVYSGMDYRDYGIQAVTTDTSITLETPFAGSTAIGVTYAIIRPAVTGIASEVCINCHTESGAGGLLDLLKERKAGFAEALEALKDQLALKKSFFFVPVYPYFFTAAYDPTYIEATASPHCQKNLGVKNWQTGGTSTFSWSGTSCTSTLNAAGTAGTGKHNMGVAFNFVLLEHDPGGYVHNRMYVKRLIYDSIDWLDDSLMNYSVGNTLNALDPVTYPYKTGAMAYLLVGGTPQPFLAAERP